MTYKDKLRDPRWQKKRLKVFERDSFTCQLCKSKEKTLSVHHRCYNGEPWESRDNELVTFCDSCHVLVENIKKRLFQGVKFSNEWNLIPEMCAKLFLIANSGEGLIELLHDHIDSIVLKIKSEDNG